MSPAFLLHKEGYSIKDYKLVARIGEGSFGQVWKAERGGFEVALKILKASVNSDETQRELKSLETLKKLHHRYLLHTENFWSDGDQLYIEMELADGGTLKDRFKACQAEGRAGIPEDELLSATRSRQVRRLLHSHRRFLHRDISLPTFWFGCRLATRAARGLNNKIHTGGRFRTARSRSRRTSSASHRHILFAV